MDAWQWQQKGQQWSPQTLPLRQKSLVYIGIANHEHNYVNSRESSNLIESNVTLFGQINPLHLPEVFSLKIRFHGHGELYNSLPLRSSIVVLLSTADRKLCIKQDLSYHLAKAEAHAARAEELRVELAAIEFERAKGPSQAERDPRSLRLRKRKDVGPMNEFFNGYC